MFGSGVGRCVAMSRVEVHNAAVLALYSPLVEAPRAFRPHFIFTGSLLLQTLQFVPYLP